MTGITYDRMEDGVSSYSDQSLIALGGKNQKVYITPGQQDYVIKELEQEFHGDSPHKHWKGEKRADAAVEAFTVFSHLFPETKKIGSSTIRQEYIPEGTTLGDALKRGDYGTVKGIFGKLKEVHDAGYIHGDITERNIRDGPVFSVDTETFGPGAPSHDLSKARKVAVEGGRGELVDRAITELYGQPPGAILGVA